MTATYCRKLLSSEQVDCLQSQQQIEVRFSLSLSLSLSLTLSLSSPSPLSLLNYYNFNSVERVFFAECVEK